MDLRVARVVVTADPRRAPRSLGRGFAPLPEALVAVVMRLSPLGTSTSSHYFPGCLRDTPGNQAQQQYPGMTCPG